MLRFGKYRDQLLKDIYEKDSNYLKWLITQPWYKFKFESLHLETLKLLNEDKASVEIDKETIIIYTDGSCPNNGSNEARCGIGVHFSNHNKIKMKDVSQEKDIKDSTKNKAELLAIECALQLCSEKKIKNKIIIYTDSKYSIHCITLWYPKWVEENKLEGKKNIDIIQKIYILYKELDV